MVFYYILNMDNTFYFTPTIIRKELERKKDLAHHIEIFKQDLFWMNDITQFYSLLKVHDVDGSIVEFKPYESEAEVLQKIARKRMNNRTSMESYDSWSKTMWQIIMCSNLCAMASIETTKHYGYSVYTKNCCM